VFTVTDVTLRRGAAVVLERVSVRVESATCVGLVGRSGAGKSTLLGLLTRLDDPDSGRITFHDRPLGDHDVLDLRRKVQLVPQQPVLVTGRVVDQVRLGRPDLDLPAVLALLARVDLPPRSPIGRRRASPAVRCSASPWHAPSRWIPR
jgi:putative ABC transport system ATP-binding protein